MIFGLLFFVGVVSLQSGQGRLMNVALLKPAYLSEEWISNTGNYPASNGVDGKTNTTVHAHDKDDWFVVDLMKEFKVQHVVVFNRACGGECDQRLKDFLVGLAVSFDKVSDVPVRGKYELCGQWPGDVYAENELMRLNCTKGASKARYVILQNGDPNKLLNFNEIEVYADDFDLKNAYMGCYGESSGKYARFKDVPNVEECLSICERQNNSFSLIKSAKECYCSNHLANTSSASSQCSLKCPADDNPCGNVQLYSVYQTKLIEKSSGKYLGCYKDNKIIDMPFRYDNKTHMTIELCLHTCLKNGYSFSGVQYYSTCFCGHSYGRYGPGDERECKTPCKGNANQICGGAWRNSIYEACYTYEGVLDTCSTDLHHCSNAKTPSSAGQCVSCEAGWKAPTCFLRDCSVNKGGCGDDKCEEYRVGEIEADECVCRDGYSKGSYNDQCQDIDECATNTDKCDRNLATCINNEGSYTCNCSVDGYENEDSKTCSDIDECLTVPCNSSLRCQNTPGSFSCLPKADNSKKGLIGGLVGGLLVLSILLICLFFTRHRLKTFFEKTFTKQEYFNQNEIVMETSERTDIKAEEGTEQGTRVMLQHIQNFFISKKQTIGEQFGKCPKGCGDSKGVGSNREMAIKNRFKLIFPYDHNRVVLQERQGDPLSHYINASFVSAYETVKDYSFIATQGPKKETLEDFWRMVVQYSVPVVVMLTKCFEAGSNKCEQYWPDSGSEKYGSFLVTLVEVKSSLDVEERVLKVEDKENGIEHTTHHLLFKAWPDKSVPQNAMSLLNLRSLMLHLFKKSSNGKNNCGFEEDLEAISNCENSNTEYIVVHCSAGVGRTGTFICLDHLVNEALHRGSIDVFEAMKRLRNQRYLMIQTKSQYELCYKCMYMHYLIGEDTLVRLEEKKAFEKKMIGLRKIVGAVNLIEKQFKIIDDETIRNKVRAVDKAQIELPSGNLDAVFSSSATKHSRYMLGVAPSSFSKQDVFTLLRQRVGVLLLLDTHNQSMNDLMSSLQDCSGLTSGGETVSFVCQVRNVVGHVMNFRIGNVSSSSCSQANELYSNNEAVNDSVCSQMKKVIHLRSVRHDVIKKLHYVIKKEDEDTVVMVLSRDTYDDASVLVAGLNVAESIETSRSFDVFQSAFEMRFSQPACLSRIDLFEKLYHIAGKLAESSRDEDGGDGNDGGDIDEDDEGYAELMRKTNEYNKSYEKMMSETNSNCVIPSLRGTILYQNLNNKAFEDSNNNQTSSKSNIDQEESNENNRNNASTSEKTNPTGEVSNSQEHIYANT